MNSSYQVAGCQTAPAFLDAQTNVERVEALVEQACSTAEDVKLAVFPELAITAYVVYPPQRTDFEYRDAFHAAAERVDGQTIRRLSSIARSHSIHLAVGFVEADPMLRGVAYNSAVLLDDQGEVVAVHRKCHISPSELQYFRAGTAPTVVDTALGRIGLSICYDFWFPEFIRYQALQLGCELHVNLTANVADFALGSTHLPIVRAVENSMYVISVNRVGRDDPSGYSFVGQSSIVSPFGSVLAAAADSEEVIVADVDLAEVTRARTRIPVLKDFKVWQASPSRPDSHMSHSRAKEMV
jgi:5-aminopentanamidase